MTDKADSAIGNRNAGILPAGSAGSSPPIRLTEEARFSRSLTARCRQDSRRPAGVTIFQHTLKILFLRCVAMSVFVAGSATVTQAQSSGVIRGAVTDSQNAAISGASVVLTAAETGFRRETATDADGRFQFFNVPFAAYALSTTADGFAAAKQIVVLRSTVPVEANQTLAPAGVSEQVTVTAGGLEAIEPARSEYRIDRRSVERLPGALASRQIENLVLTLPSASKDGKGTFHPRGAHYQASFVIDGVPVSDQLSTIYAVNFDARNTQDLSVQVGNIAPEFGNKVSAVIQLSTQSGLGSKRPIFGGFSLGAGSFATGETGFQIGGQTPDDRFGFFVSGALNRTERFLDSPFQNAAARFDDGEVIRADGRGLHNRGDGQSFFARFDFAPNERNFFKLNLVAARSRFQIPNLPSQQRAGQNQIQENRSLSVYPSWQRIFNERLALTIAPYFRVSTARSNPSPGDTPISFDYSRRLPTVGAVASLAYSGGGHQFKIGVDAFAFPVAERFGFELTDAGFNLLPANSRAVINSDGTVDFEFDPNLSQAEINRLLLGFNPNLIAYDRTILAQAAANNSIVRGAPLQRFITAPRKTGKQFSAYAQDTFSLGRLTVSGGVRFDRYNFVVSETAVSPRVGTAFRLPWTETVLRASYNRIAQTPSTENLLISQTERAASLVNPGTAALLGTRLLPIPLERADWFEIGARQQIGRIGHLDAAFYAKRIRNLHDNDQFLNTTIIFPIALARGRVDGFDFRFTSASFKNFSGYFSLGTVRARVRPPFAGGLFLSGATPEDFGNREFVIDHDQKLNLQTAVQYSDDKRGIFWQFLARHDGGLVTGVSRDDIADLLADPDAAAGVALLNFNTNPVRTSPRTIFDLSVGYDFIRRERARVGVQFDALNLTNKIGLYNYLSVFGGTNYIPSRSVNIRLKADF